MDNTNVNTNDRLRYYTAFMEFLKAVGKHQSSVKMGANIDEGVYPVQKVAYDYNLRGANLDKLIYDRNWERWDALSMLDRWSQQVGFKPISPDGKYLVMKFFEDYDRRRYVRDNIKRALKKGELLSVADLMRMRYEVERKRRKKEQAGE